MYVFTTTGSNEVLHIARENPRWNVNIYNASSAREFIMFKCERALPAYDHVNEIPLKANIFRLCILYAYGGLYMDDDVLPLFPLDTITETDKYGLLLVEDRPPTTYWANLESHSKPVWQAFIGAAWPGHPVFDCAINTVIENTFSALQPRPPALQKCTAGYTFRYQLHGEPPHYMATNKSIISVMHKALRSPRGGLWPAQSNIYIE